MYSEITNEIKDLEEQISTIERRASRRNRAMDSDERRNVDKMEAKVKELKMELPVNSPLTLQGPGSGALSHSSGPFPDFGNFLVAVRAASLPGQRPDQRLFDIQVAASGLNETVGSDGGFLVQQDFSNELLKAVIETGLLARRCRKVTISNNSNSIKINGVDEKSRVTGSRFGGVQAYWVAEADEKTKSKPKFRQIELTLKKLIGLCYASDEVIADVSVLNTVIREAFVSEFGFMVDDAIINGIGGGQPLGILNAGSLITVPAEGGQGPDTILTQNIVNMYSRLLPGSKRTSIWLINKNIEPQLFTMSLAVGAAGVPVYMPANGLAGQPFDTLFGIPVVECEQAATLGDKGDIILADFPNGYILAEKGGIRSDMSIHVRFIWDEQVFRFILRIDGQPCLASAIVPYKGGAAFNQSHFIALEAR